jgi:hypothetical protein
MEALCRSQRNHVNGLVVRVRIRAPRGLRALVAAAIQFVSASLLARTGGATVKSSDLTAISTFRSTADAQIAKGILDELGIESMIRADNAGGMYPAISGAELLVRSEDLDKAHDALRRRHRRSH